MMNITHPLAIYHHEDLTKDEAIWALNIFSSDFPFRTQTDDKDTILVTIVTRPNRKYW